MYIFVNNLQIKNRDMIINLSIQNFGSIKDKQSLSFVATKSDHLEDAYVINAGGLRLLKLALIYGANASGKTTILRALDFLRDLVLLPNEKKTEELDFEPFLFDPDTPAENSFISIEFLKDEIKYLYEIEFNRLALVNEELYFFNPKKSNLFKRSTDLSKQYTEINFGNKIKLDKTFEKILEANTLWNNTVLGGFLKTNIDFNELREVIDWFKTDLRPLIAPKTNLAVYVSEKIKDGKINKSDIVEILKKADFHISDIVIKEDSKEFPPHLLEYLKKEFPNSLSLKGLPERNEKMKSVDLMLEHSVNDSRYQLKFKSESEGTKRYYGFAGVLSEVIRNTVILPVDELESSLHPDLYEHFLLTFLMNAKGSQIIATTHNREILNNKDIFRNDAIWFTDKDSNSSTELYSLADFDSSVVRDTTNVLNAYKSGKLGATPNPDDTYIDFEE